MKHGGKIIAMMVAALALTGCGKASVTEEQNGTAAAAEERGADDSAGQDETGALTAQDGETPDTEGAEGEPSDEGEQGGEMMIPNDGKGELISDEDAAALEHVQKYMVADEFGDGSLYEVYAPVGSEVSGGFLDYIDHGIGYFVSVFSDVDEQMPYYMLNETVKGQREDLEGDGQYSDVQISGVVKNGEDRYVVISATGKDMFDTPYEKNMLVYLDVPKSGVSVICHLEISEMTVDEMTETILSQLGQCYGIGLESLMPSGEWAQADIERKAEMQNQYEPEEGELALAEVDGYQYLGMVTLSLKDGEIQCPVMAPMASSTTVMEDHLFSSMHGVAVYIDSGFTGTDNYVPRFRESVDKMYQRVAGDEDAENRNVHKSEVMEMSGYENAWYYVVDYDTKDTKTEEYYKEVKVNCRIIIAEKYALTCDITLRDNQYDAFTNELLKELETAYGIDLSAYYNEEE